MFGVSITWRRWGFGYVVHTGCSKEKQEQNDARQLTLHREPRYLIHLAGVAAVFFIGKQTSAGARIYIVSFSSSNFVIYLCIYSRHSLYTAQYL